ncbi:hypothetical protein GCM10020258_27180 [Sphingomonas yabuuchiae]
MSRDRRPPARNRRRERETGQFRRGVALFVVGVLVLLGIGGLYLYAGRSNPALDTDTLCPSGGPTAVTAVVVDVTDPASKVTQAAIRSRVLAAADDLPRFGMLKIFAAGSDESALLQPLFAKCNPGTKADVDQLTSSPELVQKRHDEQFERPLAKALDGVLDVPKSDASPILEGAGCDGGGVPAGDVEAASPTAGRVGPDSEFAGLLDVWWAAGRPGGRTGR